ncbi:MAG: ribosome biogenesis GTP-binding protein YihA/YsxC [Clostridia bacterium]
MEMIIGNVNLHNAELGHVAGHHTQHLREGLPQIAFSGRSNVGKSSLINSILGRKTLARVSGEPGKTITCNYYEIDKKIHFVDLPGYGFARRSKTDKERWSELTESYFDGNNVLNAVLQLIDCKIGITLDDEKMLDFMNYYGVFYIIVCTKCDKLNKTQLNECVTKIVSHPKIRGGTAVVLYSTVKSSGREELVKMIFECLDRCKQAAAEKKLADELSGDTTNEKPSENI